MKRLNIILVLALAICGISTVNAQTKTSARKQTEKTIVYGCPMKCEGNKTYAKAGKCPVCKMNLKAVHKEVVAANYQCPMKCEGDKMYAEAGKCPKCNMNLKVATASITDEHKGHNHN